MNRTILYYPTIDIPRKSWLRNALLYWDEVSSIVPRSWDDRILIELSPEIRYLMDENQFRPIKPESLINSNQNWDILQRFQEEFIGIVKSEQFGSFSQPNYKRNLRIHQDKVAPLKFTDIHANKTSESILHFLEERGLAKKGHDYEWISMEKYTALLYMSLLAKYLADIEANHTTIGTDFGIYENFNFKRVNEEQGFPVISMNLENVLPTPKENVPLEKIIDFKRKRSDNLLHFKKVLSDFNAKIGKVTTNAELKEVAIDFKEVLINGVNDLDAVLNDSRIERTLKSFKALINIKSPTTLLTIGATLNENFNLINVPLNWTVIGIAAVGAIELGSTYIESRNRERAKLRESPFSYVYQAYKFGLVHRPV